MVEGVVRNGVGMKKEAQIEAEMEKNMNKGGGLGGGGLAAAENIKKGGAVGVGGGDGFAPAAAGGGGGGDTSSVVRWERFLPKMVLRVLLVEADDSTRQIITALLRKCSFRVAAVSDGLKAWEVLKRRPHNVDLILTEVDLSSISGFALLTLIMEHEICKNIPVIMMSSKDSVSTVYKCMLRGATDFLMKPVRKNELRNLWQHVWRKQVSTSGRVGPPDENVAEEKFEATAENNALSNPARGYMACIERNRECTEKESDAESSCAKPEMDTEEADIEWMQSLSQRDRSKSLSDSADMQQNEGLIGSKDIRMQEADAAGSQTSGGLDCQMMTQREDMNVNDHWQHGKSDVQIQDSNHVQPNPCREAIDLLGAFDLKCTYGSSVSKIDANEIDYSAPFELSLRRTQPGGSVNQDTDHRHKINHSDASAFSRYVYRASQPHQSPPSTCSQWKSYETSCDKQLSYQTIHYISDARTPPGSSQRHVPQATGQSEQAETGFTFLQQRVLPAPIPVRGVMFGNLSNTCGPVMPPIFRMQSGQSSVQNPGSVGHEEASFHASTFYQLNQHARNSQQYNGLADHMNNDVINQIENRQEHKLEKLENRAYFSTATDQSANSSCCNGTISEFNRISYGNNGSVNPVVTVTSECGKEEAFPTHDGNPNRSIQREAALSKFRLKRKERCYGKKVRYESRKKLAEQRPRVKGQFVRHAHEPPPDSS